jgi:paraquat-inducible protein A
MGTATVPTAARLGLALCRYCRQVSRLPAGRDVRALCPRCGAALHVRLPDSVARTWAFLIAACALYVPANLLPVMRTSSLFGYQRDTIMSGVAFLWRAGSPGLAVLVFAASVVIPLAKLLLLSYLLLTVQRRVVAGARARATLHRVLEGVGRWSMLDVFVISLLVGLLRIHSLAEVEAGPGAAAFGVMAILTLLAARSFDPRLIWDAAEAGRQGVRGRG